MPGAPASPEGGEPLHHPHVVWLVFGDVVILLGSLQDQRNVCRPPVAKQPSKGLLADLAVSNQNVPVLVGTECAFTVIEMKEGRRGLCCLLELIEDSFEVSRRPRYIVTRGEEVASVETVSRARAKTSRNGSQDCPDLGGSPPHSHPGAGSVFNQ